MPEATADEERARLLKYALELALDVSREGAHNLSDFLAAITDETTAIADKAGEQMREAGERLGRRPPDQRDGLVTRGARLANDAVCVALDVALAARDEFDRNPTQRNRTLDALSQVVSFAGSLFVDTANQAVGTSAGGPSLNRTRQVTVELAPGTQEKRSAWVVNRGDGTVTDAAVYLLHSQHDEPVVEYDYSPTRVTVDPGRRVSISLTVTVTAQGRPRSFVDALLVVEGVGSIVVRTIVRQPDVSATSTVTS